MLKSLTYICLMLTSVVPVLGQDISRRYQNELRLQLRESKQDTSRILILYELGRTYLKEVYSDKKASMMDTAIEIFHHAVSLSDTLGSKSFWCESMLLEGEGYLNKDDTAEGKQRFRQVASFYHAKGDIEREGRTWLRLARKMNRQPENYNDIEAGFARAAALYKQAHDIEREASVQTYLADFLFVTGRYGLAQKELLQVLDSLHKIGSDKVADACYLLSVINRYLGSYEKSLLYATKCVENAERNNDPAGIDIFYGELALVYDELGNAEESSRWYRKALCRRMEKQAERAYIFKTASFLIRQWTKLKKSSAAFALMDSLISMYRPRNAFEKAIVAQNYAYCFDALKQYPEAEKYLLEMIADFRNAGTRDENFLTANMDIGRFYLQRRQFWKAGIYLDTALIYSSGGRLSDQREVYKMLFTADSARGNYPAAIKDLQQYQFINDSIFNDRKSRQIEELTIRYATEKKEQSIRLLEQESYHQKSEITRFRATTIWVAGVAVLLIIIIGLLINYSRLKQRTNRELQVQQRQIEKKNYSLHHLVKEKEWLVKEIHHRVKNNFHMVMGLLHTQSEYLQGKEAIQAIAESRQRIQAMSLVHQKLYQSDNLSAINMVEYIHELADCLKDSIHTSHNVKFSLQIDPVKLDFSHCVPIGLILNEAITNSLKHGFPGRKRGTIDISFKRLFKDRFSLSIKDDGIGLPEGFDYEKTASMGMKLMRGLSDDIDAALEISDCNGTEILLGFTCEEAIYSSDPVKEGTINYI